jgi:hypothetical protein
MPLVSRPSPFPRWPGPERLYASHPEHPLDLLRVAVPKSAQSARRSMIWVNAQRTRRERGEDTTRLDAPGDFLESA